MVRTIAIAFFGLALACTAQAMPLAPVHQPDNTITQVRMGCGAGRLWSTVSASPEPACARSAEPCGGVRDTAEAFARQQFGSASNSVLRD